MYEPEWQERYLGATAPVEASLRAKYASIALDVAWALMEWRVHENPSLDPNAVWASLSSEYLHIKPHPEWGWWAMRGQLIDRGVARFPGEAVDGGCVGGG